MGNPQPNKLITEQVSYFEYFGSKISYEGDYDVNYRWLVCLLPGFLLDYLFSPKYRGEMFLRNVGWLSEDYM
jgi:hypothetical protein